MRNYTNFHRFIKKLSIKINPKSNITKECKDILNNIIIDFCKKIIIKSSILAKEYGKQKQRSRQ